MLRKDLLRMPRVGRKGDVIIVTRSDAALASRFAIRDSLPSLAQNLNTETCRSSAEIVIERRERQPAAKRELQVGRVIAG